MWRQGLEGLRTWSTSARPAESSFMRLVREEDGTLQTPGPSCLTGPACPGSPARPAKPEPLVSVSTHQLWREASARIDQSIAIMDRLQNLMESVPVFEGR